MTLRLSGGRRLQSPPGSVARPTTARVRLAVLNLLTAELPGSRWLDLCSGSGVMACEALQRGARQVVAIEHDRRVAAVARANLQAVAGGALPGAIKPQLEVVEDDVLRWLGQGRSGRAEAFELIYADPPWAAGLYEEIAAAVAAGQWLSPGGTMVWECPSKATPVPPRGWLLRDQRRYGSSTLMLLQLQDPVQRSAAKGAAAAVLVPGGDEQADQGDRDQTEHDAAEQGFDHGVGAVIPMPHSSMMGRTTVSSRHHP